MLEPRSIPDQDDEDFYPYYDEEPVSESDVHRMVAAYLDQGLRRYFRDRPDVYVSSNLFVYYQQGDRDEKKVSPDVFVCFGAPMKLRKTFRTWAEGAVPQVVFEITSESSRLSDQGDKRAKYTAMGVEEYYLFDPFGEWIPGKFRAYRREGDELVPVVTGQRFRSPRLELELGVEDTLLRLYEPSGAPLPTTDELALAADEAQASVREAQARVHEAQAQAQEAQAQAQEAQAQAQEAQAQAQASEARALKLEEELRRLQDRRD